MCGREEIGLASGGHHDNNNIDEWLSWGGGGS